jgi:tRNA threonylcarbamoyladenosine biosynthesis protein TsaE
MTKKFHIASIDSIDQVANQLVQLYPNHRVMAFWGAMGVGKTTFVKALCRALQVDDTVNSPSFAIVNEYSTSTNELIYHFDFYRIRRPEEAFDLGYEDYLYSGAYCFLEWPEKIEELLPADRLDLVFELNDDNSRTLTVNVCA